MRGVESQSGERIRAVWLGKLELEGPGPFFISVISYFNRKGNCGPGRRWDLLNAKSKCMETSGLDCAGPLTFGLDSLEPDERCFLGKMNECRKRSRDTYAGGTVAHCGLSLRARCGQKGGPFHSPMLKLH